MATITRDPTGAWTCDPGPLRCPSCRGPCAGRKPASTATPKGAARACRFATACSSSATPRPTTTRSRPTFTTASSGRKSGSGSACSGSRTAASGGRATWSCSRLPKSPGLRLLDVAIGDGVYTSWLPEDWSIVGVDVSTTQLAACQRRNAGRDLRLVLGEAEDLPFRDGEFDAVLSNGGFNHFTDPEAALREMARVAKPGAPVVIADEAPDFLDLRPSAGLARA